MGRKTILSKKMIHMFEEDGASNRKYLGFLDLLVGSHQDCLVLVWFFERFQDGVWVCVCLFDLGAGLIGNRTITKCIERGGDNIKVARLKAHDQQK